MNTADSTLAMPSIEGDWEWSVLLEYSLDIIQVVDRAGVVKYVNPAIERILGYDPSSMVGTNAFDYMHPEERDDVFERFANLIDRPGEATDRVEHRLKHVDGGWVWAESIGSNQTNTPLDGYVINTRDVSEQFEYRRQLETLTDNLPGLVYRCGNVPGWPMHIVRGAVEDLVGYSPEAIESGTVDWGDDIIHPADRERVWDDVQEAIAQDRPFRLTYRVLTSDGSIKWVWEQGRAVVPHGSDERVLEGFIMDITDRHRLEEDLRESLQQMQVIDRVLRHNLRNQMNVVLGTAQTIAVDADEETAELASNIVEGGERLLETADKERRITAILSEPTSMERFDIGDLVDTLVTYATKMHPHADISVTAPEELEVVASQHLGQAILELTNNAIEHSDRDHPAIDITISDHGGMADIAVVDDGPGIPKMERDILSEEAEMGPLYHGRGLGLWLVKLVVRDSEGTLEFEENEPRGSIVRLSVPVSPPTEAVE